MSTSVQTATRVNWWGLLAALAAVVIGSVVWAFWLQAQNDPLGSIERGQSALAQLQQQPDEGRGHVAEGTALQYKSDPPTSGTHYPMWVNPGFYTEQQPPGKLVHSLEHGHIVIYYDPAGADAQAKEMLQTLTRRYPGTWDGVLAVPRAGLGTGIILTAWRQRLDLPAYDRDAAAAFLDRFRGRGPEHPVR